jgi:hypothetical protein
MSLRGELLMSEDRSDESAAAIDRLCSEIQLFDLCDLDSCGFKRDRFCTNELLLRKFEAIREEDDRHVLLYDEDELEDDGDLDDFDDYADEFDDDGSEQE